MEAKVRGALVKTSSVVTLILYCIIALLLIIAAIIATMDAVAIIGGALTSAIAFVPTFATLNFSSIEDISAVYYLNSALQAILLVIVIVSLIDMVKSYIKVGRIMVRPILIAGLTTMVRRLLVMDNGTAGVEIMIGEAVLIIVLAVSLFLLGREDRKLAKCAQDQMNEREKEQEAEGKKKRLFGFDE